MDHFFPEKLLDEIFWDEPTDQIKGSQAFPPAIQSAFAQYRDLPRTRTFNSLNSNFNVSKRMLAFMRKTWPVERNIIEENERDRSFKHMLNERMRRQRQRHCCLALHSMLPQGTKKDYNSVIQLAAKEIVRLQGRREELERSNVEYLKVPNPNSGIDSMVDILKCLKNKGVDTKKIKSTVSPQELFAVLEIETDKVSHFE